jgi:hypothetical protein
LLARFPSTEKNEIVRNLTHDSKVTFPEQLIRNVVQVYGGIFKGELLKNELTLVRGAENVKEKFSYKLLQWFHSNTLEQTCKLANAASTIPATTASVARSFSAPPPPKSASGKNGPPFSAINTYGTINTCKL